MVGRGVGVSVGVAVGVSVGVAVGVSVGAAVDVSVGVAVDISVNVAVGVEVAPLPPEEDVQPAIPTTGIVFKIVRRLKTMTPY